MTIKWGDPIECNGVRPDWLRDYDQAWGSEHDGSDFGDCYPAYIESTFNGPHFRLPADHPAYVALARGFHPWSGGESAPDDWDGGAVLQRCGYEASPAGVSWVWPWRTDASEDYDIIGYRKRVEYGAIHADGSRSGGPPPRPFETSVSVHARIEYEDGEADEGLFIKRMTRAEIVERWGDSLSTDGTYEDDVVEFCRRLGLIRPETTAERFTRETGHAVTEAVEAALNWKGE